MYVIVIELAVPHYLMKRKGKWEGALIAMRMGWCVVPIAALKCCCYCQATDIFIFCDRLSKLAHEILAKAGGQYSICDV